MRKITDLEVFIKFIKYHRPILDHKKDSKFCTEMQCADCKITYTCYSNQREHRAIPRITVQEMQDLIKSNPEYFI